MVPVTILSGFLGSGKTTLLNHLLHGSHGYRLAVIVNEFGEVGIDGAAVAGGEQFVQLDNGCLCCAVNEDLETTIRELKERGGFDHLVLECTGVADPVPVAWAFSRPGLSQYYRVDAVVTVIDAKNVADCIADGPEARLQIERADLLLLNKLDLVDDDGAAAMTAVRELNDIAPMVRADHGEVPWEVVLTSDEPSQILGQQPDDHAHHHFQTCSFPIVGVISDLALEDLLYDLPDAVYRVKGLVRTDAGWEWTLVNGVAGRLDLRPLEPDPAPAEGALVFIGRQLDVEDLAARCATLGNR